MKLNRIFLIFQKKIDTYLLSSLLWTFLIRADNTPNALENGNRRLQKNLTLEVLTTRCLIFKERYREGLWIWKWKEMDENVPPKLWSHTSSLI